MQKLLLLCALAACCASSGCSMMLSAARTLVLEPLHYCAPKDACFTRVRDHKLAEQAWKDLVRNSPEQQYTEHYEDGFKDGFADYLFLGGSGSPPMVPPRRYWRPEFETPEGHLAIEQWYEGFAHGASAAQASGLRQLVTVPPPYVPAAGPFIGPAPWLDHKVPAQEPTPPAEELPPPATTAAPPPPINTAVPPFNATTVAPPPIIAAPQHDFRRHALPPAAPMHVGPTVLPASYQAPSNAQAEAAPPPHQQQQPFPQPLTPPSQAAQRPEYPLAAPSSTEPNPILPDNRKGSLSGPFLGPWIGPRAQLYLRDAASVDVPPSPELQR